MAGAIRVRRWPELVAVLALIAVLALDWAWLARFRHEYPLDIDEAGYMANAYDLSNALRGGSLGDFWNAFQHHGNAAPLVPLLTAPVHLVLGEGILRSFITQSAFLVLLVGCAWGIGRRFSAAPWAALTVLVVLGIPELIDYTRHYHFAIGATALLTAATYALIRTERLERRGWALAWGAAMGLTALSRTLAASFLPGLVLAGALAVWASPERRRERVVNLGLGVGVALAVAAVWWFENGTEVVDYLRGEGFRDGPPTGVTTMGPASFLVQELRTLVNVFYLPLALALGAALIVGGRAWWQRRRAAGLTLASFARSDAAPVAVTVACGLAVLFITKTGATGSGLTLMPLVVTLAVGGLARLPRRGPRKALVAALAGIAVLNVIAKSAAIGPLAGTTVIDPPQGKRWVVFDGSGLLQRGIEHAGYQQPPNTEPLADFHRGWIPRTAGLSGWMADFAAERGQVPIVATGELDLMFNNNTLYLGARLVNEAFPAGRLQSGPAGDSVAAYREQLGFGTNFVVLTEPPPFRVGDPPVSPQKAAEAARSLGFRPVLEFELPDRRRGVVFWLDRREAAGGAPAGVAGDDFFGGADGDQ